MHLMDSGLACQQRQRHGLPHLVLDVKQVGRVRCPQRLGVAQQCRSLVRGGLDHINIQAACGCAQRCVPGRGIPLLGVLFQQDEVRDRLHRHQADVLREGSLVLADRGLLSFHARRKTRTLLGTELGQSRLDLHGQPLLRSVGRCDERAKARQLDEQAHQADPTGAHPCHDQVSSHDEAVQKGHALRALEEGHRSRRRLQVPPTP